MLLDKNSYNKANAWADKLPQLVGVEDNSMVAVRLEKHFIPPFFEQKTLIWTKNHEF